LKIRRRKIFRWCVDFADGINFWFQDKFNINPKRKVLEAQQDMIPVEQLEKTIGRSLGL
jgi:hypothetical protein